MTKCQSRRRRRRRRRRRKGSAAAAAAFLGVVALCLAFRVASARHCIPAVGQSSTPDQAILLHCALPFEYVLANGSKVEVESCEEAASAAQLADNNLSQQNDLFWCTSLAARDENSCLCMSEGPFRHHRRRELVAAREITLQTNQVGIVATAVILFAVSVLVAGIALLTCAAQSMRYPFEDIAAANAATRLAYHYDRAGILGGCLTSGMGWREAAVLLKGFGKLPRMLVHARIVTALLGVASLPLILQGPACFATPMIVICGLVSTVWHVCITILGLSKLKVLGDRRRWQKQVATFERKMSQRVSATTIVFVVEFMLFTFAAASGFAGIVMYHIEKTSLAAATLTLLNAILAILGPVLAAHTAWMGNDLDALTPDLEKLHAHIKHHDREKTRSFHASFRSSFRQGVAVGMSAAVAASVEQTTETVKDNASFRQGSAKQSSMGGIDVTSLSDATNEAESGEAFAVPSRLRRASVAQDLLRVSGAWGVVNLFNRGLGIVLALIAASMWLLGSASALEVFAGLFGFALILLNGLHLCFDLRMRYAVQYRKLVAKFCGGDAENFATDSARELARVQDTPPVILCWKNQTPGRVMLVIETAALILVILTISRANSIPSSSLHPCAVAGTVLFICLVPVQSAALVFSYMACFGYAGGEIEVPKDRLAVLMRNVTAQHNRQSTRGFVFPIALRKQSMMGQNEDVEQGDHLGDSPTPNESDSHSHGAHNLFIELADASLQEPSLCDADYDSHLLVYKSEADVESLSEHSDSSESVHELDQVLSA